MTFKIIRIIVYCLPGLLLGWIVYLNFLPLNYSLCQPWFCSPRVKIEPNSLDRNLWQNKFLNLKQSFYFDVTLPRNYDFTKAQIELTALNSIDQIKSLNFGNLVGLEMSLRKNIVFDQQNFNSSVWNKIKEKDLVLYQRKTAPQFGQINDFLANLPSLEQIAQYNYDLSQYFNVPGYQPQDQLIEISQPLSGSQRFVTYLKGESLFVDFKFDSKSVASNDSGKVSIYQVFDSQKLIQEKDFDLTANSKEVEIDSLPEGAYFIDLEISEKVIVKKIQTKQHWFMIEQAENDPARVFIPPYQAVHNPGNFPADPQAQEIINYIIIKNEEVEISEAQGQTVISSCFTRDQLVVDSQRKVRFIIESGSVLEIKQIKVSFN